ncbi:hypothetical protein PIB30_013616 [Stylosanthes scabra]|uniref:Pectate lyase n=1 Tax=Stylosanthes scabra TaxID=79078 RepID=A0ABU6U6R8_9FABA|nr:hypothetical protein [Stylosanthes scabra]
MFERRYIVLIITYVLKCIVAHGTSKMVNLTLTLPGHHPNPEALVTQVHSRINASIARREMLAASSSSCLTGNPIDDCWKCDPNWSQNRQSLADCAIGFGQNAKGGKGGQFYIVTDSSDNDAVNPKPGTLRYAVIQTEPLWIVFPTNMMIKLSQELIFNSFKTIDGRGADVHIVGNAMVRSSPEHYGYRTESDGDGISIFGSHDIWIDHCTLSRCKDGLIDAVMGSTAITVSNNHFSHHNDVMLLGHSDHYLPDSAMQVTIAFNHFGEKLVQRMPRCRLGYVHIVNNDYTAWQMYAIGGSASPTINSQGNRFTAPDDSFAKQVTKRLDVGEGKWTGWNWRSEGDVMVNGAFFVPSGEGAEVKYEKAYSVEPKSADRIALLTMSAGVLGVARDNNLGMWTRGPNDGGSYISTNGPEFTDEMSKTTMLFPPSHTFTFISVLLTMLCLFSHTITPLITLLL